MTVSYGSIIVLDTLLTETQSLGQALDGSDQRNKETSRAALAASAVVQEQLAGAEVRAGEIQEIRHAAVALRPQVDAAVRRDEEDRARILQSKPVNTLTDYLNDLRRGAQKLNEKCPFLGMVVKVAAFIFLLVVLGYLFVSFGISPTMAPLGGLGGGALGAVLAGIHHKYGCCSYRFC